MIGKRTWSERTVRPVFIDLADIPVSSGPDEKAVTVLRPSVIDDLGGVKALLRNREILFIDMSQYRGDAEIACNLLTDSASDCGARLLRLNDLALMVAPFDTVVKGCV